MIMKKLMAMVMLTVFLVSMIPAAFAQEDASSPSMGTSNTGNTGEVVDDIGLAEPEVQFFLKDKIKHSTSIEECSKRMLDVFPDVNETRAKILCKRFLEKPVAVSGMPRVINAERPILKSVAVRKIQEMNKDQFRDEKQSLLEKAIVKCKETNDPETCEEKLRMRIGQIQDISAAALTRVQNFEQRKIMEVKEFKNLQEDKDFRKFKEEKAFKARNIAVAKVQKAKKDYIAAKEKFVNARANADDTRNKFRIAKEKAIKCEGDESEECEEIRTQINAKAKEHIQNIADVILEHLNKIKSRAESNEDITEEEAAEIIAEIDAHIAEIEAAKETVATSESKEEIIEAAKETKKAWQVMKKKIDITIGKLVNARIGGIIVKSEQLQIKLERIMGTVAESGNDTQDLEVLVNEFNSNIDAAKENYKLAVERFNKAKSAGTTDAILIKEGQRLMKAAHANLQDAQKNLRDIVHAIKQFGAEEELEEDESDKAEAEVDEDVSEEEEEESEDEDGEEEVNA